MDARQFRFEEPRPDRVAASPGRVEAKSKRPARRAAVRVDGLESRQLLSGMIVDVATLPAGESAGPASVARDGSLYYGLNAGTGSAKLGHVTVAGALTEIALPGSAGGAVSGLAADPSGNVWYSLAAVPGTLAPGGGSWAKVGRVAPDGTVTEFPLPSLSERPGAVAAGNDGNVWVAVSAEGKAPAVVKVTPDGGVTELPVAGAQTLQSLTAAPDGTLWFVDGWKIGKLAPGGAAIEFPVTTAAGAPADLSKTGLSATSDGNVWFTEPGGVGKVSPAGTVTSYPSPGGATPTGLHAASDGNLWYSFPPPSSGQFSDAPGALLVRLKADGTSTVLSDRVDATGTPVVGMAAGADAAVWLNEGGTKFGRLGLASVPTITPPIIRPTTPTYLTVTAGQPFAGSVVSFVPNRTDGASVTYKATIDWGDGHVTAGDVTPNSSGGFTVNGQNAYAATAGSWMDVRVVVTDSLGGSAVIFNRASIQAPPVAPWQTYKTKGRPVSHPSAPVSTPVAPLTTTTPAATTATPGTPAPASTPVNTPSSSTSAPTSTAVSAGTAPATSTAAAPATSTAATPATSTAATPTPTPATTSPTPATTSPTPVNVAVNVNVSNHGVGNTAPTVVTPVLARRRGHAPVTVKGHGQAHGPRIMGHPSGPLHPAHRAARRSRY